MPSLWAEPEHGPVPSWNALLQNFSSLMDDHCSWMWTGRQAGTSLGLAGAFSGEKDCDPPCSLLSFLLLKGFRKLQRF